MKNNGSFALANDGAQSHLKPRLSSDPKKTSSDLLSSLGGLRQICKVTAAVRPLNRSPFKPSVVLVVNGDVSIHSGENNWTAATKKKTNSSEKSVRRKTWGRHQHRSQWGTRPCDLQGLEQVYDAVCQRITALMLPLNCLPQQPVKAEETAADWQLDWYVDWSLWTTTHQTWWSIDFPDLTRSVSFETWLCLAFCFSFNADHLPFPLFYFFFFYLNCCGMPTILKVNTGSLWLRKVPITRPVLYARFCHPPFSLCPSWNLPPRTPTTPSPLLNTFFFFWGGTLRKNVIHHIQPSAPKSLLQTCSHWFSQRINCSK